MTIGLIVPLRVLRKLHLMSARSFTQGLTKAVFGLTLGLALGLAVMQSTASPEVPPQNPFPGRHLTIVHPFAAGGLGYELGHVIGDRLKKRYDLSVVVEAKPGANTVLGVTSVLKANPDGLSLLINSASIISIAGAIYKKPPYDPATDLVPVAFVARVPLVLVVNSELPVRSLDDLATLARTTPAGLSYGSTGIGSAQHLSGEFLKRVLGLDMTHVPFRGPVPALTAVAGGHVALMFIDVLNAKSLIEAGKVRPIALTSATSAEGFRTIPTFADAGLHGFDVDLRFGLYAPARTPAEIVARMNALVRDATSDAGVHERFGKVGVQIIDTPGPKDSAAIHRQELERWQRLVKDAKLDASQ